MISHIVKANLEGYSHNVSESLRIPILKLHQSEFVEMLPALLNALQPILAWQNAPPGPDGADAAAAAGAMVAVLLIYGFIFLVSIAIACVILYVQYKVLDRIPPQFRQMEPWQVFLVLIPCFGIIWIFFVVIKIPASLQAYFYSKGRSDVGDCGAQLGIWYLISGLVGCAPVSLVMLVMYLMKIWELQKQIV